MFEAVRFVFAGSLFLVGGLVTLTNWHYLYLGIRHPGESVPSYFPLIGGVAGVAGLALAPLGSFSDRLPFLWLPFVLDPGSALSFSMFIAAMVSEVFQRPKE